MFWRAYGLYGYGDVGFVSQGPDAQRAGTKVEVASKSGGNHGDEFGRDFTLGEKHTLPEYPKTLYSDRTCPTR